MGEKITIATWNAEWISRRSGKFERATDRINELRADVLVLTELNLDLLPRDGHVLLGGEDWGCPREDGRYKVALWSRWPIEDRTNDLINPPGRHVAGTVDSPVGCLRVHGVCVLWRDAHVKNGRRDSHPWQEHLRFLDSLATILKEERRNSPIELDSRIVLGDINQRGGQHPYRNDEVREMWDTLCSTGDLTPVTPDWIVDKIALGKDLKAPTVETFSPDGISDHSAVRCGVAR